MLTRRRFLATAGLGAVATCVGQQPDSDQQLYAPAKDAVERGLAYLAAQQNKDGSFGNGPSQGHVAITSLAALAMLSGGHLPGQGALGAVVEKATRYVLRQADANGLLNHSTATPKGAMYSHGFGALLLAEVHGTILEPTLAGNVRDTLRRAVRLLLDTQNAEGGWRYEAMQVEQADLSVTVAQAMALRAAHNVGIAVPKPAIEQCIGFLQHCQVLPEGGFRYMPGLGGLSFPLTAAGLVGLHCCGVYEGTNIDAARRYLLGFLPTKRPRPTVNPDYYLYGHYYAVQAMRHWGGEPWRKWYAAIRDELGRRDSDSRDADAPPNLRQADGSWTDAKYGAHYATAMACIILQRPKNYLPVLQH